jgi:hypothetical protein
VDVKRFYEVVVDSQLSGLGDTVSRTLSRYDDGNQLRVLFLNLLEDIKTMHVREAEIYNQNVIFLFAAFLDGGFAGSDTIHHIVFGRKSKTKAMKNGWLIIDEKNSIHALPLFSWCAV